jgi:phytoene/squalene synthetase
MLMCLANCRARKAASHGDAAENMAAAQVALSKCILHRHKDATTEKNYQLLLDYERKAQQLLSKGELTHDSIAALRAAAQVAEVLLEVIESSRAEVTHLKERVTKLESIHC